MGERSEPSVVRWVKNFILPHMSVCDIYMLYIHNLKSARKILQTRLLKKGNGRHGNLTRDTLDSLKMKKKGC